VVKDHQSNTAALSEAIRSLQGFSGINLTQTLARIETSLRNATNESCARTVDECGARTDVLSAAGLIKTLAAQIHVAVHALGILLSLEHILKPGEVIDYVSLGAGNTGKAFDLETNLRLAEFKFIRWQGGSETIRQNSLFKDFYLLAEYPSDKQKFLYVLDNEYPAKFLNGGRALASVLSRNVKLRADFIERYGERYRTVREYYLPRKDLVVIQDILPFVPELIAIADESEESLL
jgi:hypothetical protein